MGSRNMINIWLDSWLPRWAGGKVSKNLAHHFLSMVSNLIEHTPQKWKGLITNIFYVEEAAAILCVPLPRVAEDDVMVWVRDCTGEYSVKSGYRLLNSRGIIKDTPTMYKEVNKKLWLMNLPPKSKITICRMMNNFIPTAQTLYNWRIAPAPTCPRYSFWTESILHAILECGPAKDVWD